MRVITSSLWQKTAYETQGKYGNEQGEKKKKTEVKAYPSTSAIFYFIIPYPPAYFDTSEATTNTRPSQIVRIS